MHSKWRYKICICSVILGFRNYKGSSIIFPNILVAIFTVLRKWEFSDQPFHHIFESERFRSPCFLRKILQPGEWNVKNLKTENRREFIRYKASKIVRECGVWHLQTADCRLQTADRRLQTADCIRQQDCKLNETKSIVIKVASSSTLPCSEKYM